MEQTETFKHKVARVLSGEFPQREKVSVCETPTLLKNIGFIGSKIIIEQNKLRACVAPEDTAKRFENHHDLPIDFVDNLPKYVESPAMILSSMTQRNSVVIVTDSKDKQDRPIIIALSDNHDRGTVDGEVITYSKLASAYGRTDFPDFLRRSIETNGLLYLGMKKSRDCAVSAGLQLPGVLANLDSTSIIRRFDENVNTFKQKTLKNPKSFLPENYGQTLRRSDGLPLAYIDADGRQRVSEYGKRADGSPYLAKTTVTLSDGRVESTEYGANGKITRLQRFDNAGRKTYSYFSDDAGISTREESTEYGANDRDVSKSIHEKSRELTEKNTKESWRDFDERNNIILSKLNVYGNDGKMLHASEVSFTYDGYGNVNDEKDRDGCVTKYEYYPPSVVRDHFGYTVDDYNRGTVDHDRLKTETTLYPDGNLRVRSHTLDGSVTQSKFSADGKLLEFINENGEIFRDGAAERAMFKSSGQAPTKKQASSSKTVQSNSKSAQQKKNDVAAKSSPQKVAGTTTVTKTVTKTVTASKPSGKSTGRGGSGAGR